MSCWTISSTLPLLFCFFPSSLHIMDIIVTPFPALILTDAVEYEKYLIFISCVNDFLSAYGIS
ncbi:hypothetical protein M426DRAFT_321138 [Hypoxylon sp. CI-4A]|nr:hypothetical protein M426DRAFT_321138 [Hypoxylon sp. CI-4A]